mgnify:CR=1 FL=1
MASWGRMGSVNTRRSAGPFVPQSNINHARQRWLFRMVHSDRPLQEKMTLFWHNHFATGYNKIAGALGATEGARYLAAKASEDPGQVRGQIEMLRDNALGNFQRHPARRSRRTPRCCVWLDGRTNTKAKPQENFGARDHGAVHGRRRQLHRGRRLRRGARVHAAGTCSGPAPRPTARSTTSSSTTPASTTPTAKTFSFAIYPDGGKTIPARPAATGCRTASTSSTALAAHPNTARYLAAKLYRFFVSEFGAVNVTFVNRVASVYLQSRRRHEER